MKEKKYYQDVSYPSDRYEVRSDFFTKATFVFQFSPRLFLDEIQQLMKLYV